MNRHYIYALLLVYTSTIVVIMVAKSESMFKQEPHFQYVRPDPCEDMDFHVKANTTAKVREQISQIPAIPLSILKGQHDRTFEINFLVTLIENGFISYANSTVQTASPGLDLRQYCNVPVWKYYTGENASYIYGIEGTDVNLKFPFGLSQRIDRIKELYQVADHIDDEDILTHNPRCVLVGSSASLNGSGLGEYIDDFDVVVRFSCAPVKGFEKDVGSKTTHRMLYPESSLDPEIMCGDFGVDLRSENSTIMSVIYKPSDIEYWICVFKGCENVPQGWRNTPNTVTFPASNFRLINPKVVYDSWIFMEKAGKWPSSGLIFTNLFMKKCSEVVIVGFSLSINTDVFGHYYE